MDRNEKQNSYRNTRMTRGIPNHPSDRGKKTPRKTHFLAVAAILLILILGAGSFTFYVHRNQEKEPIESGGTVAVNSLMPAAGDRNPKTGGKVIMTNQTDSPGAEEGRPSGKPEEDSESLQKKENRKESESESMAHTSQETTGDFSTTEEPVPSVTEPATEGISEPETEQETDRETEQETDQESDDASDSNTKRRIALYHNMKVYMENKPASQYRIILKEWRTDHFENVISLPEFLPEPENQTSDERLNNFFTLCYTYSILENLPNEDNILKFLSLDMNDRDRRSRAEEEEFPVDDSNEAIRQIYSRIGYWIWNSDRDHDTDYTYDPSSDPYGWQDIGKNAVQSFASAQSENELSGRADQAAVLLSSLYKRDSTLWREPDIFRNLKKRLQASPSRDAQNSMFTKQFYLDRQELKEFFTCYWVEDVETSESEVCAAFLLEPKTKERSAYILVLFSDFSLPETQEKMGDDLADYICGRDLKEASYPIHPGLP